MVKCVTCNKTITKKAPGLECSKCELIVHASSVCAGLSAKQLNALKSADNLDWTCNDCSRKSPRRGSFITPDEDEDEGSDTQNAVNIPAIDVKKFLGEITKEVDKIVRRELKDTNEAVQFCSDKVDECLSSIEAFQEKIKSLEKKNTELVNKNTYLENRLNSLEQRINEAEQDKLRKRIEVVGIPTEEREDLLSIVNKLAEKMDVDSKVVKSVERPPQRAGAGKPSVIVVQMEKEQSKIQWLTAARQHRLVLSDVKPNVDANIASSKIYLREALTPFNKELLWKTKEATKGVYKYVWCRSGRVKVRKGDNEKEIVIRSVADVEKL